MNRDKNIYQDLKWENRNRIFNKIREAGSISSTALTYELQLSRPTVKQNLDELLAMGCIFENGSFGHTGGRRARAYSVVARSAVAVGIDVTRHHITVILVDLCGNLFYQKRVRVPFSREDEYLQKLGNLVEEALESEQISGETVLGVGIAVPGLITDDHQKVFYGKILDFTGMSAAQFGKYIPFSCRLYNDADSAGYAEVSRRDDLADAFYISLSNNVGGSVLIDRKIYKGEGSRSGEVGHMTIVPGGRGCYCGQKGCLEAYCNAAVLSACSDGDLDLFFEKLESGDRQCREVWDEYLQHLAIAVNNVRMLFDCRVILGGYIGAYLEQYLPQLKELAAGRNSFEKNADYIMACSVKKEALALGSALPFIHEYCSAL